MPKQVTIYHNPRCSKSRQTLALLQDRGIEPIVVEYLKTPPSAQEIEALIGKLDREPRALIRTKEAAYKDSGLSDTSTPNSIAKAIAKDPVLLERPVVVCGNKAAIGRPPEKVLEIL